MNTIRLYLSLALIFVLAQNNFAQEASLPQDGIYQKTWGERPVIHRPQLQERDVLWEKRIWREIELGELQNQHFANENRPLIELLTWALEDKKLSVYNEDFSSRMDYEEAMGYVYQTDTFFVMDLDGGCMGDNWEVVKTRINPKDVTRFRIKEVAYVDKKDGQLKTQILGIAPIRNIYDDNGNFLMAIPMFWFHFDELRPILGQEQAPNRFQDAGQLSWADVFEARQFSSYITKESNMRDLRLQDLYSGTDRLLQAEKIKDKMANYEHDLYGN